MGFYKSLLISDLRTTEKEQFDSKSSFSAAVLLNVKFACVSYRLTYVHLRNKFQEFTITSQPLKGS